jgi:hypothetical protein
MTVAIQLSDEQAAALQAQAAAEGLTVDVWLQRIAEQYVQSRPLHPPPITVQFGRLSSIT